MVEFRSLSPAERVSCRVFLRLPNVVGFDNHIRRRIVGGKDLDDAFGCVRVFVTKKIRLSRLHHTAIIPSVVNSTRVDVVEVGYIRALSLTERYNKLFPGISIGHYRVTAGSLGCRVFGVDGEEYVWSNNHVLANGSSVQTERAFVGDAILQPGPSDGGRLDSDKVAELADFIALNENGLNLYGDMAVARITDRRAGLDFPGIVGFRQPKPGEKVAKVGRTTESTVGQVESTSATMTVEYNGFQAVFEDVSLVLNQNDPISPGTFLRPGDSGSLVFYDDTSGEILGLGFAGSDKAALVCKAEPGLTMMKMYLFKPASRVKIKPLKKLVKVTVANGEVEAEFRVFAPEIVRPTENVDMLVEFRELISQKPLPGYPVLIGWEGGEMIQYVTGSDGNTATTLGAPSLPGEYQFAVEYKPEV